MTTLWSPGFTKVLCFTAVCSWSLRLICSDWDFPLDDIAKVAPAPILVATASDDVVCAPQIARYVAQQIPGARIYESRLGWNHDFMFVELDKLMRLLLDDGVKLDLPDGRPGVYN
eukprot:SAG31_NODE_1797_length_7244_cov_8.328621_4_plen_115_part_00